VRKNLRDFIVGRDESGKAIGCAGLHLDFAELAEIYGFAVLPQRQGQGNRCDAHAVLQGASHHESDNPSLAGNRKAAIFQSLFVSSNVSQGTASVSSLAQITAGLPATGATLGARSPWPAHLHEV
jgi:acetyltransferase (GNAT) family protein